LKDANRCGGFIEVSEATAAFFAQQTQLRAVRLTLNIKDPTTLAPMLSSLRVLSLEIGRACGLA
jgi:hypothetical protein